MVSEKLPHKDDSETWKRVVAVIVTGKAHQFKEYPFKASSLNDLKECGLRDVTREMSMSCCITMFGDSTSNTTMTISMSQRLPTGK